MKQTLNYDRLPLMPEVIAETVCGMTYTGMECNNLSSSFIKEIEEKRSKMNSQQIKMFVDYVDKRCRLAYHTKCDWFMKCVKSKSNKGRANLYGTIIHWLAAFLKADDKQEFVNRI